MELFDTNNPNHLIDQLPIYLFINWPSTKLKHQEIKKVSRKHGNANGTDFNNDSIKY
jgi:hypothetical protein